MCAGGLGGEAHHQHRADREVGRNEDVRALAPLSTLGVRTQLVAQGLQVKAGGPDHDVHARAHAFQSVLQRGVRTREVDDHLGALLREHLRRA